MELFRFMTMMQLTLTFNKIAHRSYPSAWSMNISRMCKWFSVDHTLTNSWSKVALFGALFSSLVHIYMSMSTPHNKAVSPDEINLLLGQTTNCNRFWPIPDWYESLAWCNKEWTEANEAWFVKQTRAIRHAEEGSLCAGRMWQNTIGLHTAES